MEIEIKYRIEDDGIIRSIMENRMLVSAEKKNSREILTMNAVYFDTKQADLQKNHIAFRIRLEGSTYIATIKAGGSARAGLHKREEINIPVTDDDFIKNPKLSAFSKNRIIDNIAPEIADKKLIPVMEMSFVRERLRIMYKESDIEVSIDQGDIVTVNGSCPICEIELELYSGNEKELIELGEQLQQLYNLKEENMSKYARGLSLLEKK